MGRQLHVLFGRAYRRLLHYIIALLYIAQAIGIFYSVLLKRLKIRLLAIEPQTIVLARSRGVLSYSLQDRASHSNI